MSSPDWGEIARIFHAALALDPGEREAFVDGEAAGDATLHERVLALLAEWEEESDGEARSESQTTIPPAAEAGLTPSRAEALLDWFRQEPEPGDEVGRYRVIHPLGRGGAGAVYLAEDLVLGRKVALKFLPARIGLAGDLLTDRATAARLSSGQRRRLEAHDRLLQEARAASALDHPHIGTVFEIDRDTRGRPFLAMAAYSGGSLRDRLNRGPLRVAEAVEVARQVASALAAAHLAGILHRDVKPENLVFDADGRIKVVDFGIARTGADGSRTDEDVSPAAGTAAYMAPERLDGALSDESADLWALAAVLYEMLTGTLPWQGRDRDELRAAMERPPPAPRALNPAVPQELSELVLSGLALDPDRRPASAAELEGKLARCADSGRWNRRMGWMAAAAVAVLLAGGMALGQTVPRIVDARGAAGEAFPPLGRVLVADFRADDEVAELGLAAREALVVDLQQSPFLMVLGRREVADILARMGLPTDTVIGGGLAFEVAERLGAGVVVEGTVARVGNRVQLSARGVQPTTGSELFAVRSVAGQRRLLASVESLSREVRERLGEAAESLAASRPLPDVTTASIEALRLYAEAERALVRDPHHATLLLEAAIDVDPTFAMAHRLAASAALGTLRYSSVAEHLTRAWQHRDRLPERERWHVEALYASEVLFEPREAERMYERILASYPGDVRSAANLGSVRISWLGDPDGARDALQRALALDDGQPGTVINAIHVAHILGLTEEVDSLARHASSLDLGAFNTRWPLLRDFAEGRIDAAMEGCRMLPDLTVPPFSQASDDELCGSMAVAAGRWDLAERYLTDALETYHQQGRKRNVAHVGQALAMSAHLQGDTAEVRRRIREVMELLPPEAFPEPDRFITRTNLSVQAALLGLPDLVPRIQARYPAYPDPDHWFGRGGEAMVEAAILLARGDGERALAVLDGAFPRGVRAVGWRIYEEVLLARALELTGANSAAADAWARAANPGWMTFPFTTKDRIHLPMAVEGRLRAEAAAGLVASEG